MQGQGPCVRPNHMKKLTEAVQFARIYTNLSNLNVGTPLHSNMTLIYTWASQLQGYRKGPHCRRDPRLRACPTYQKLNRFMASSSPRFTNRKFDLSCSSPLIKYAHHATDNNNSSNSSSNKQAIRQCVRRMDRPTTNIGYNTH